MPQGRTRGGFQSTLPARGATPPAGDERGGGMAFQSTLPARGATVHQSACNGSSQNFNPRSPHGERLAMMYANGATQAISIHAPRTGSDVRVARPIRRERHISIHAPRTGSDVDLTAAHPRQHISIHAPRTGSDCGRCSFGAAARYFNPRSPHGERPTPGLSDVAKGRFQSTLPARGATIPSATRAFGTSRFQSTLPARGATAQSNNSVDQNHRLCTKSIPQNSPFEN